MQFRHDLRHKIFCWSVSVSAAIIFCMFQCCIEFYFECHVCVETDSGEAGEYYVDDECIEFDNMDSYEKDEMDDVTNNDRQPQSASIG